MVFYEVIKENIYRESSLDYIRCWPNHKDLYTHAFGYRGEFIRTWKVKICWDLQGFCNCEDLIVCSGFWSSRLPKTFNQQNSYLELLLW